MSHVYPQSLEVQTQGENLRAGLMEAAQPPVPPDPPLPPGWRPMRSARDWMNANKAETILLHTSYQFFIRNPSISIGYWAGGCWVMVTQFHGDPRTEPIDPDGWMPLPQWGPHVSEANAIQQQIQEQAAAPVLLLAWLLKHAGEQIALRDILRLGPSRLRETKTAIRAVEGLVRDGWLTANGGNARSWTVTMRLQAERVLKREEDPHAVRQGHTFDRPPWLP